MVRRQDDGAYQDAEEAREVDQAARPGAGGRAVN